MKESGALNLPISVVAGELGMPTTDIAEKNEGNHGFDMDYVYNRFKTPWGWTRDSMAEVMAAGKAAIDWDNKWHLPGTKQLANGRMHGIGFSWNKQWQADPNAEFFPSTAVVSIPRIDGTAKIIGRHADGGWNSETSWCQIVADELGMKYDDVECRPFDYPGFDLKQGSGSSGLVSMSPALVRAARQCKQRLLEMATESAIGRQPAFKDLAPDDLDVKDSIVFEKANPENSKTVYRVVQQFWEWHEPAIGISASIKHDIENAERALMRQAHFVEVEVDTETGEVIITKVVNVNDVGKCVTPESVRAQQYGGAWMGISNSRNEAVYYDPQTGVKLNDNLIDYKWFSMNDIQGPMEQIIVETGMGYGPYGICGCSEAVGATMATCTSDAIFNAIGKRITSFPTTPDKILKALGKA